jgi:hypothetical protein
VGIANLEDERSDPEQLTMFVMTPKSAFFMVGTIACQ